MSDLKITCVYSNIVYSNKSLGRVILLPKASEGQAARDEVKWPAFD